jgi:hypothetical protein
MNIADLCKLSWLMILWWRAAAEREKVSMTIGTFDLTGMHRL